MPASVLTTWELAKAIYKDFHKSPLYGLMLTAMIVGCYLWSEKRYSPKEETKKIWVLASQTAEKVNALEAASTENNERLIRVEEKIGGIDRNVDKLVDRVINGR